MANSSIKITNKNIYTIDIKDEDDNIIHTLKFHINDANFPVRMIEAYDKAKKVMSGLEEKEEELKNKILAEGITEVPYIENITTENVENTEFELSPSIREFYMLEAKVYEELREVLDSFLGKGSCQAIFGDYNDKDAFSDFLEGLLPEFEKMGVKIVDIQKNMYKKYAPKTNKVI